MLNVRPTPLATTMNKPAFAVVCIACAIAAVLIVVLRIVDAVPARDFFATIVFILVLPALAWLRLRREGRSRQRAAEFERMVVQAEAQPSHPGAENPYRRFRRRFVAGGILGVGLCMSFGAPQMVFKGTKIPVGWLIALIGAMLFCGELMGINVFRGGPLDRRLDPQSPPEKSDLNEEIENVDK